MEVQEGRDVISKDVKAANSFKTTIWYVNINFFKRENPNLLNKRASLQGYFVKNQSFYLLSNKLLFTSSVANISPSFFLKSVEICQIIFKISPDNTIAVQVFFTIHSDKKTPINYCEGSLLHTKMDANMLWNDRREINSKSELIKAGHQVIKKWCYFPS